MNIFLKEDDWMPTQPQPLITREGKKAILRPGEDITASNVPDLRAVLKSLVAEGVRDLEIDLVQVQIVDSSGIGLLVAAHNSLNRLEGQLVVTHASINLLELFKSFRLDKHFSVTGAGLPD
jgi:anti-anti-sigma factor